jgi:hypothetical protein
MTLARAIIFLVIVTLAHVYNYKVQLNRIVLDKCLILDNLLLDSKMFAGKA